MNIAQIIFYKLEPILISFYKKLLQSPPPNLEGDRHIEYSWIFAQIPDGPGYALDFGCGSSSYLGLAAARKGFEVLAINLGKVDWPYSHPNLKFIQEDFLKLNLQQNSFDLIINCSSIEHVGLAGRYGVRQEDLDGDLETMKKMKEILKPTGIMLLTIPVGQDAIFKPFHRIYGKNRLPKLLNGWKIEKEEYWVKNDKNQWVPTNKTTALDQIASESFYGLGCFVLKR